MHAALCCMGRLQAPDRTPVLIVGRFDRHAPSPLLLATQHDLEPLLQHLASILHDSHASMQGVDGSQAAKVAWWKRRLQLDGRMCTLLHELQHGVGVAG